MGETMKNANFFLTSNYLLENDKINNKEINELFYTYLNKINISLSSEDEKTEKKKILENRKRDLIKNKNLIDNKDGLKKDEIKKDE